MSINAVMKELQQKQRDCTSLQAAVQAATQDLTAALSKRDDCYDRLDCELAAGESIARQSIRTRLFSDIQHANSEVADAADVRNRWRPMLAAAQRDLREYGQKVDATYGALRQRVPEEVVELMSRYIFSPDPDA